jgi:hypothetical protein
VADSFTLADLMRMLMQRRQAQPSHAFDDHLGVGGAGVGTLVRNPLARPRDPELAMWWGAP